MISCTVSFLFLFFLVSIKCIPFLGIYSQFIFLLFQANVINQSVDNSTNMYLTLICRRQFSRCQDYNCEQNIIYTKNPKLGLKIIANAFKKILDVNIDTCPFDVSIDYKLELVKRNVENKLIDISQLSEKTLKKYKNLENILQYLNDNKFYEKKCFSHGDTSLPNIFALNNEFSGFIDVGECGIADQWFDLAICEKSIRRNFGEEYISEFYKELNITPDREKIDYYLLMMELYL